MLALPVLMQTEVIAPIPPIPDIPMPPWMFMSPPALVLTSLGFFAAVVLITYPLVRALARRLEGRGDHIAHRLFGQRGGIDAHRIQPAGFRNQRG